MQITLMSKWFRVVVEVGPEAEDEEVFVSNTGGDFDPVDVDDVEYEDDDPESRKRFGLAGGVRRG